MTTRSSATQRSVGLIRLLEFLLILATVSAVAIRCADGAQIDSGTTSTPGESSPAPELKLLDREELGLLTIPTSPSLPLYIGIAAAKLSLVSNHMPVFAVEHADCSVEGSFLIGSYGRIVSARTYAHHGRIARAAPTRMYIVKREARFAVNNFFGTVEDTENILQVSKSVNDQNYWCIPRQEFCYKDIAFSAFGGEGYIGDTFVRRGGWVFSAERGVVTAFAAAVSELCALGGDGK